MLRSDFFERSGYIEVQINGFLSSQAFIRQSRGVCDRPVSDGPGISVAAIITRSDTVALLGSLCTGRTKNEVNLYLYLYELFKCKKTVYGHAGFLRVAGWIPITVGASERYLTETTARHGRFSRRGSNQAAVGRQTPRGYRQTIRLGRPLGVL